MKLLLLLAFVASAYSAYFEPGADCDIDLCFMFDSSGSVSATKGWILQKVFSAVMAGQLEISTTDAQVGVVRMGADADLFFELNKYLSNGVLLSNLIGVPRYLPPLTYSTNLKKGLKVIREDCFGPANGERPNHKNVAIVLSDGCYTLSHGSPLSEATDLRAVAEVVTVSVGQERTKERCISAMKNISDNNPDRYFDLASFAHVCPIAEGILEEVCPDRNKVCEVRQGIQVKTFDGLGLEIVEEQKTLIARQDQVKTDPCKFQVRAVSTNDCHWDPPYELKPMLIDWCGVSFGKHTRNSNKFRLNYLLTQEKNRVRLRGQNVPNPTYITTFPDVQTLANGLNVKVDLETQGGDAFYKVRSECDWAVDWRPRLRESELDVTISPALKTKMVGICGDANDNEADDWRTCDGTPVAPTVANAEAISLSCKEGPHQGQGIPGCTKTKK